MLPNLLLFIVYNFMFFTCYNKLFATMLKNTQMSFQFL